MPEIAVVVPVHNTEPYLRACLDSLLAQTLADIEIIAVENGSTDGGPAILAEYAQEHPGKIRVLTADFADLSLARNAGADAARAPFVAFLDSDDTLAPTCLEKLLAKQRQGDFDVVACGVWYEGPGDARQAVSHGGRDAVTPQELRALLPTMLPTAWNKLYRRDLLEKVPFIARMRHEDVNFWIRLVPHLHTLGVVEECLYHYQQRAGSMVRLVTQPLVYMRVLAHAMAEYKQAGEFENHYQQLAFLYVRYLYATTVKKIAQGDRKRYGRYVRILKKGVRRHFPRYRRLGIFYRQGGLGLYLVLFCQPVAWAVYGLTRLKGKKNQL